LFERSYINGDGELCLENDEPMTLTDRHVEADISFDDIELTDNAEDGLISGDILTILFKGTHYQVRIKTESGYEFFVNTKDQWDPGDSVGITVDPKKIKLTLLDEDEEEEGIE
jgi:spermidine/putrescine transport system ATP-binding protein